MDIVPATGPNLCLSQGAAPGRVSVDLLRQRLQRPAMAVLAERFRQAAEHALVAPGPEAGPERERYRLQELQRSLSTLALAYRLWGEDRHLRAALTQFALACEPRAWQTVAATPDRPLDLDPPVLGMHLALAWDWLREFLPAEVRQQVAQTLAEQLLEPLQRIFGERRFPIKRRNNWSSVIFGGCGVVAMALAPWNPQARALAQACYQQVLWVLQGYGPEGEFNESVGYADSFPTSMGYFLVRRGFAPAAADNPDPAALLRAAQWLLYAIAPPGLHANHGDSGGGHWRYWFLPDIASLNRDPVLQGFYLQALTQRQERPWPLELIGFDPDLLPAEPALPHWPRGRAFSAHAGLCSSRSSWDLRHGACAVFGKTAIEPGHEHNDAGTLLLHGHGQALIVDSIQSGYPEDYWGLDRYRNFHARAASHNLITFGDHCPDYHYPQAHRRGRLLASGFADDLGGWWQIDLSEIERGIGYQRTVAHLAPNLVAVLDQAAWPAAEPAVIRWHLADDPLLGDEGHFSCRHGGAELRGLLARLDDGPQPIPQARAWLPEDGAPKRSPFLLVQLPAPSITILTLLAVCRPDQPEHWRREPGQAAWLWPQAHAPVRIAWDGQALHLRHDDGQGWQLALDGWAAASG